VLIEGLDLAGKSTLVRAVQAELVRKGMPFRAARNALCPDNPLATVADELRRDPLAGGLETGALFLAAHLWDARNFRPPSPGTLHLQDSCWLRTLAYHRLSGTPGVPDLLAAEAVHFPRFDAAVYLTAEIDVRQQRLEARLRESPEEVSGFDWAVVRDPERFCRMDAVLQEAVVQLTGATILDTTKLAPPEVTQAAAQILGLRSDRLAGTH
jgi:thymidylate kinase